MLDFGQKKEEILEIVDSLLQKFQGS